MVAFAAMAVALVIGFLSITRKISISVRARIEFRIRNGRVFFFDMEGMNRQHQDGMDLEPEEQIEMVHQVELQEEEEIPVAEAHVIAVDDFPVIIPLEEQEEEQQQAPMIPVAEQPN